MVAHNNIFLNQDGEKNKVFLFKMCETRPSFKMDFITKMLSNRDLEDVWIMFDHIKQVKNSTTMACHV